MTVLLVTKDETLIESLAALEPETVPGYMEARGTLNFSESGFEAIIFDASTKLLKDERVKKLVAELPLIIWQQTRNMQHEQYYLQAGVGYYCSNEVSAPLMQLYIDRTINRAALMASSEPDEEGLLPSKFDWLHINVLKHEVKLGRYYIALTVTEFALFQTLMSRPGFTYSRDQLMDVAYDETVYVDDRTIDSHIKRLRAKLRKDSGYERASAMVETIYGVGYVGRPEAVDGFFSERQQLTAVAAAAE